MKKINIAKYQQGYEAGYEDGQIDNFNQQLLEENDNTDYEEGYRQGIDDGIYDSEEGTYKDPKQFRKV